MARKIGVRKLAELVLEDTEQLLSPIGIWNKARTSKREEIKEKVKIMEKGQSPDYSIGAEIYCDLKKPNSIFYQPVRGISKFCLAKHKSNFPPGYLSKDEETTTKKREHHHYIIMLNTNPDHMHPNDRKIKIGYGKATNRLTTYRTSNPEAYIYREWIHSDNIEADLLELAGIFGKCLAKKGHKFGSEVFIISQERLDKLVRHYDSHVFDKRINVEE